jgi:hypothetical protein
MASTYTTRFVSAPAIITGNNFRLSDRIKIQCERIRQKDYIAFGRLTAIHWEAQRDISGLSQSRPRWGHPNQPKLFREAVSKGIMSEHQADALKPFSEKQNILWQSTTLDWLDHKRGPIIARSRDHRDWLLPEGLTRLPPIPDPRFVPLHARSLCRGGKDGCQGCNPPRVPQLLVGCPIVGDRVQHRITSHNGYTMGVIHPILELSVVVWAPDGTGHFLRLQGSMDNVDRLRPALLIDDEDRAFLVGGVFA